MTNYKMQGLLLGTLIDARRPLSTKQIAIFSQVAWKTARDNLEKLFNAGLVYKGKVGKNIRIYWKNA